MILRLSLFLSFFLLSSFGAQKSFKKLKKQINEKTLQVNKLSAQLNSLEKSIVVKNQNYLKSRSQSLELEERLVELNTNLKQLNAQVSDHFIDIKKSFELFLIEKLDEEQENPLEAMVYKKLLDENLEQIKTEQMKASQLTDRATLLSSKVEEFRKTQAQLYEVIVKLEKEKSEFSEEYISQLEKKNILREKFEKALARQKIEKKKRKKKVLRKSVSQKISSTLAQVDFALPIMNYKKISPSKDGVNFVIDNVNPVVATASGVVVYSGDLSSYGKIVMIDHGNDIRSLVLGSMSINAKKGDRVNKGQIIAYTKRSVGHEQKLYYEIRKKDKAQNTFKVLKNKKLI